MTAACHAPLQTGCIPTVSRPVREETRQQAQLPHPDFNSLSVITGWLNIIGIVCCVLLLLSYLVLPADKSSRHYLSVGLVISLCLIQVFPADSSFWTIVMLNDISWDSSFRLVQNPKNATMQLRQTICTRTCHAPCLERSCY